jgi:hypothetical protein
MNLLKTKNITLRPSSYFFQNVFKQRNIIHIDSSQDQLGGLAGVAVREENMED